MKLRVLPNFWNSGKHTSLLYGGQGFPTVPSLFQGTVPLLFMRRDFLCQEGGTEGDHI